MSAEQDEGGFVYLGVEDALEIYAAIFGLTTTQAEDHLRSRQALKERWGARRAMRTTRMRILPFRPQVLAHGIAETQPFVDGNKREALIAMITFLELNGHALTATDPELASWMISFGSGATPEDVAEQLRVCMTPVP